MLVCTNGARRDNQQSTISRVSIYGELAATRAIDATKASPFRTRVEEDCGRSSRIVLYVLELVDESEVIDDIIEALKDMSRLEEGLLGNLSLQSDSSQAETKTLGDGAALNAKAT